MRKYAIKGLEIFHGFLLLSLFYCALMLLVTDRQEVIFYKSLIFLPVIALFSISVKRVRHFWQYMIIIAVGGITAFYGAGQGIDGIWLTIWVGIAAFSYFVSRAKEIRCWLDTPTYPWLSAYLLLYLLGNYFENDFLMRYASFGAGLYFLITNFHINLTEMEIFVRTHSSLERLPVKQLGRINQGMMWMVSGVTIVAMFASPYLGIDEMIRQAGRILRKIISWLIRLIPSGTQGTAMAAPAPQAEKMMQGEMTETSLFMVIILKIMNILGWIFAVSLVVLFILMILKKIYELYRRFNRPPEENGDKIERLIAAPSATRKKDLKKAGKENLFWDRSANARIRKHYKKKILRDLQEAPPSFWTPSQMEENVNLSEEDKKKFHEYYEKARYSRENCSKEEMREMLNIRQ